MLWRLFNSGKSINKYLREDAYALVTGSSDGIGKGIAEELLSRGFNVFLHGRNPEKLSSLKDELSRKFENRTVQYIVADASEVNNGQMEDIVRQLEGKKITVLVNNLAWVGGEYDSLGETSYETAEVAMNSNVRFFTHITRTILPILTTNEPSLILNVSSFAGRYSMGYLSLYSATKAYMNALSRSLIHELQVEKKQIEVVVVELQNAQSSQNKAAQSLLVPNTQTIARKIVDAVGHGGSDGLVVPYWSHELVGGFMGLLPRSRVEKLGTQTVLKDLKGKK